MMTRSTLGLATLLLAAPCLPGCTGPQAYEAGLNHQRQQCYRMPDTQDMKRCLEKLDTSYETYKREREAARDGR